jgi:uncharacterized short protein YbdD (DUF466 family)
MKTTMSARVTKRAVIGAKRLWQGIREWCGDAAYEHYLKSHARQACCDAIMSREQFYLEQLQTRYSRVSRCC